MKPLITINARHLQLNKNFEKRILQVIPKITNTLTIDEFEMKRIGTGQYKFILTFFYNGVQLEHTLKTNSSSTWDWYQGAEINRNFINWKKGKIINFLGNYFANQDSQ